jgi:hypothetical protein
MIPSIIVPYSSPHRIGTIATENAWRMVYLIKSIEIGDKAIDWPLARGNNGHRSQM